MTPLNDILAPDRRWSMISHDTARAWPTDQRPKVPAKSSRERQGARIILPQPHPMHTALSPKSHFLSACSIAASPKSP